MRDSKAPAETFLDKLRALRHAVWRLPAGWVFPPCQICGVPLAPSRDCRAHVLPPAVGGRLAARQVVCRDCEATLAKFADAPLIAALGSWPERIGIQSAARAEAPAQASAPVPLTAAPSQVFPGALRALWLLHLAHREWAFWPGPLFLERLQQPASLAHTIGYLPDRFPGLHGPAIDFAHIIVLKSVPPAGLLVGYVEIFGALRIGGILARDYRDDFEAIYVIDPLTISDHSVDYRLDPRPAEWVALPTAAQAEDATAAMELTATQTLESMLARGGGGEARAR